MTQCPHQRLPVSGRYIRWSTSYTTHSVTARAPRIARALDRSFDRSIDRNRIAADYVARLERSDVAERPARGVRERKGTRASERANARTRRDGATAIDRAIDCLISMDRMGWMIAHRTGGATRAGCVREDRARERMRGGDDRGARRGARSRGRVDVGVGWSIGGVINFWDCDARSKTDDVFSTIGFREETLERF